MKFENFLERGSGWIDEVRFNNYLKRKGFKIKQGNKHNNHDGGVHYIYIHKNTNKKFDFLGNYWTGGSFEPVWDWANKLIKKEIKIINLDKFKPSDIKGIDKSGIKGWKTITNEEVINFIKEFIDDNIEKILKYKKIDRPKNIISITEKILLKEIDL